MCPPNRVAGVTARSRFTGDPSCKPPSVDLKRVSFETSAVNESGLTSSAVRHTPFTAIESPLFDPSVAMRASMIIRASSPRFCTARTRPSSSIIPVNIIRALSYLVDPRLSAHVPLQQLPHGDSRQQHSVSPILPHL